MGKLREEQGKKMPFKHLNVINKEYEGISSEIYVVSVMLRGSFVRSSYV